MTIPVAPNYRVVTEKKVTGEYHYTATGTGLLYHKPYFDKMEDAETFVRCLSLVFNAGKQARSRELQELLAPVNKYLFLDCDGVVNSAAYFAKLKEQMEAHKTTYGDNEERLSYQVDPDATFHLSEIVRISGCKVVISSSWRQVHTVGTIKRALHRRGFEYASSIIDKTPYSPVGDSTNRRGIEIQNWLDTHTDGPYSIVILDDDRDMGPLLPRLVKTTWQHGLLAEHVPLALQILETP